MRPGPQQHPLNRDALIPVPDTDGKRGGDVRGMVFTELLKMAEEALGEDAVDHVLDTADLPSKGAYTEVGNYSCRELMTLVLGFWDVSGHPPDALQKMFGHWMFGAFNAKYPSFFADKADAFAMLEAIDGEIHVEVAKLYPDAELPRFEAERTESGGIVLHYASPRPLVPFCHGLIEACLDHFGETAEISVMPVPAESGGLTKADFVIRHAA